MAPKPWDFPYWNSGSTGRRFRQARRSSRVHNIMLALCRCNSVSRFVAYHSLLVQTQKSKWYLECSYATPPEHSERPVGNPSLSLLATVFGANPGKPRAAVPKKRPTESQSDLPFSRRNRQRTLEIHGELPSAFRGLPRSRKAGTPTQSTSRSVASAVATRLRRTISRTA
jgi:hypothetical protein